MKWVAYTINILAIILLSTVLASEFGRLTGHVIPRQGVMFINLGCCLMWPRPKREG